MTTVRRISLADMVNETGMPTLGYSRPQNDEILLVDGLPKSAEKEVLAHEYEHMGKGEEGPFGPLAAAGIMGGASILGGIMGGKAAKDAAKTSAQGSREALAENRRQFDLSMLSNILLNAPSINTGNSARSALAAMLGLDVPGIDYSQMAGMFGGSSGGSGGAAATGGYNPVASFNPFAAVAQRNQPQSTQAAEPGAIAQAFSQLQAPGSSAVSPSSLMAMIENTPGYQFAKGEAMDSIASQGRALGLGKSGASVRAIGDTIGQSLAMPAYNDYLNRLAGLAGAATGTSSQLAGNIGNLATNAGGINAGLIQNQADSRASGILGQSGAWQGALNSIADVAGNYFGGKATIANPNYNGWINGR